MNLIDRVFNALRDLCDQRRPAAPSDRSPTPQSDQRRGVHNVDERMNDNAREVDALKAEVERLKVANATLLEVILAFATMSIDRASRAPQAAPAAPVAPVVPYPVPYPVPVVPYVVPPMWPWPPVITCATGVVSVDSTWGVG